MYVRQDLDTTVGDLHTLLQERGSAAQSVRVAPDQIRFALDATDPVIRLGSTEVPATETALAAFGETLQIPSAFLKRAQDKVQAQTMNALLTDMVRNTVTKDLKAIVRGNYLQDLDEWGKESVQPHHLTQVAQNVLSPDAPVARLIDEPGFFGFDVYAPEGFAHGYGGEGVTPYADGNERNDITAGGLRLGVNLKQGLAPFVEEWMFRLACTNGMEVRNSGLKLDARGQSVDEVIAELESLAQVAFGKVEADIAAFYELKEQRVENPERAIRAISRERGIPNRSTMALLDLAAGDDLPDQPTMFDVVNLITNFANSPQMGRDGGRLILERAGGSVISEHASRCNHCLQKVTG